MRKGILSLEDIDAVDGDMVVDTPEEAIEQATAFVEAPENDMMDMAEAETAIDAVDGQAEEAVETADTLAEMGEAVAASAEEGGMSEPAARAVEIAVESLRARLGYTKGQTRGIKGFPAMEDFKGKDTRISATMEALESIKATVAKVWENIIKFLKSVGEYIAKYFKAMFDAAKGLKLRAESLKKKAQAVKGKQTDKVVKGAFVRTLIVDGTMTPKVVLNGYEAHTKSVAIKTSFVSYFKDVEQLLTTFAASDDTALLEANGDKVAAKLAEIKKLGETAGDVTVFGLEFGGAAIRVQGKNVTLVTPEIKELGETDALSGDEAIALCGDIAAQMGTYEAREKAASSFTAALKDLMNKAQSALSKETDKKVEAGKKLYSLLSEIRAVTVGIESKARSYDIAVSKAALAYAGASVNAIGGKAAEKPAEEAKAA